MERIVLRGIFRLQIFERGKLVHVYEDKNLVVNNGRTSVMRLLGGAVAGKSITQIAFGTNGAAPSPGDSAITNQFKKPIGIVSYPTISSVQFDWTLEDNEMNGVAIAEFGLLTADNTLFARKNREVINKNSDIRLVGNWQITF